MTENEISYRIIGCALELHKTLGAGLLGSAYEAALSYDLQRSETSYLVNESIYWSKTR